MPFQLLDHSRYLPSRLAILLAVLGIAYRYRMCMFCKQINGIAMPRYRMRRVALFRRLLPLLLADVSVKVEQKDSLILDIGEEVVVSDEIEYAWSTESEEVRKRLSWLSVCNVSEGIREQNIRSRMNTYRSARHSIKVYCSRRLSKAPSIAKITVCLS